MVDAKNMSTLNSTDTNQHTQISVADKIMNLVHSTFGNSKPLEYEYKVVPREHDFPSLQPQINGNRNQPNLTNFKNTSILKTTRDQPQLSSSSPTSLMISSTRSNPLPNMPCNLVRPPNMNSFNIYSHNKSINIESSKLQRTNETELLLLWNSGVDALGNALLGYLTTYWDAMRSGRTLVASRYGMIQMIGEVFDLGIEFVDKKLDSDHSNPSTSSFNCPNILFDYAKLSKEVPIVYRKGANGGYLPGGKVACSRVKNFHFDRPPPSLIKCYFQTLECNKKPRDSINPAKQGDGPNDSCGEKGALRQLFLGPSKGLQALAPHFSSHWAGADNRLHQLFFETRNAAKPIWDAALHLRVQFKFVESGIDERDPAAVKDVEAWLANPETKAKLIKIVNNVKRHKKVYVASETALVRRHVADMIRAQGVEADYFMLSGTTHPVGKNAGGSSSGRHYNVKDLHNDEIKAHSFFPYLEWWALAHSKVIYVHRHQTLSTAPSTYSGSAHIYGGWR